MVRLFLSLALASTCIGGLAQSKVKLDADDVSLQDGRTVAELVSRLLPSEDVYAQKSPGQFPLRVRVLTNVKVSMNGTPVFVPRSAYADLAWVQHATLHHGILMVQGGDASESYNVRIRFNSKRVMERRVFAGSSGSNLLEMTNYREVIVE